MPEFLRLSAPTDALERFLTNLPDRKPRSEIIETTHALGRVTIEKVCANQPLPEFRRSTVDGYAVSARDTFGTSDTTPGYLTLIGEVPMGGIPAFSISPGACASIHTGGMLPDGADAVVMLEYSQIVRKSGELLVNSKEIEIMHAVAEGENVLRIGEDVSLNQVVIEAGKRIRPAEIGGCMALGILKLRIATKPIIGILSSGDEVIPPDHETQLGQVRDINSYSLGALVEETGGQPVLYGIIHDNLNSMIAAAQKAMVECDAVIITAGSSASARDTTAEAISALGRPGVLVHGVNVRPGKPTILAVCDGKAVIGLPGNPVSALVIAELFVVPLIERLLGSREFRPRPSVIARLSVNIPSQAGREDWIPVKLAVDESQMKGDVYHHWIAEPVFGKSNLIFSLSVADGYLRIPPDRTGINAGENVEIFL